MDYFIHYVTKNNFYCDRYQNRIKGFLNDEEGLKHESTENIIGEEDNGS